MPLSFVSPRLKMKVRYGLEFPLRSGINVVRVRMRFGPKMLRVLVASDLQASTSEQQFAPLFRDSRRLRDEDGIVFERMRMADALRVRQPERYDVVLAKLGYQTPERQAVATMTELRERFPAARLLYFDGDDDSCVQWPALLPIVDLYVKKHMFADADMYQRQFRGKNNLTEYVAEHHGRSFTSDPIPLSGIVPPQFADKLVLGWNIALDDILLGLYRDTRPATESEKTVDVMCRAACTPDKWIHPLRGPVQEALTPLRALGYSVVLPDTRVDAATYYREMRSSRICVSPFGYGELCWRDFETIVMGSLLVKPDMAHIRTEPDLFEAGVTYAPVRWDFSDLAEVCAHYLADTEARLRITRNAYERLVKYYRSNAVLDRFRALLTQSGVPLPVA